MGSSIANQLAWQDVDGPNDQSARTDISGEHPAIEEAITALVDSARDDVSCRLEAMYDDHAKSHLRRYGSTLKAGIEIFEGRATGLIASLVQQARLFPHNGEAFDLIHKAFVQFLGFLDDQFKEIIEIVDFEIQEVGMSVRFSEATRRIWDEKRSNLIASLEQRRSEFSIPFEDFSPADLELHRSEIGVPHVQVPPADLEPIAEQAGRQLPGQQDWHEMWADLAVRLSNRKLEPIDLARLTCAMSEWFSAKGLVACQAEVDQCGRLLWRKHLATQRVTSSIAIDSRENPAAVSDRHYSWSGTASRPSFCAARENSMNDFCGSAEFQPLLPIDAEKEDGASCTVLELKRGAALGEAERFSINGRAMRSAVLTSPRLDLD